MRLVLHRAVLCGGTDGQCAQAVHRPLCIGSRQQQVLMGLKSFVQQEYMQSRVAVLIQAESFHGLVDGIADELLIECQSVRSNGVKQQLTTTGIEACENAARLFSAFKKSVIQKFRSALPAVM